MNQEQYDELHDLIETALDGKESVKLDGLIISKCDGFDIYMLDDTTENLPILFFKWSILGVSKISRARVIAKRLIYKQNDARSASMLSGFEFAEWCGGKPVPTTLLLTSSGEELRARYDSDVCKVTYSIDGNIFHVEDLRVALLPKRTTSQMIEHMNSVHREHGPKPPARYNVSANLAYELRCISFDDAVNRVNKTFSPYTGGVPLKHMTAIVQCCKGMWFMPSGSSVLTDDNGNMEFEFTK